MNVLELAEGRNLGNGILKVDGFINHQLDLALTMEMGREFVKRFEQAGIERITKVVTAEVSGIAPAFATGIVLDVPVIFARKTRPITLGDHVYRAEAISRTKGGTVELNVSPEYLLSDDRVVLVDEFLARGSTTGAFAQIVVDSGATLCGIGCVALDVLLRKSLRRVSSI